MDRVKDFIGTEETVVTFPKPLLTLVPNNGIFPNQFKFGGSHGRESVEGGERVGAQSFFDYGETSGVGRADSVYTDHFVESSGLGSVEGLVNKNIARMESGERPVVICGKKMAKDVASECVSNYCGNDFSKVDLDAFQAVGEGSKGFVYTKLTNSKIWVDIGISRQE